MDRRRRIDALFDQALDLGPAEREKLLAELRQEDESLAEAVSSLLESITDDDEALVGDDLSPELLWRDVVVDLAGAREGQYLGPYRILRRLGHGGMSEVYLAERDDHGFKHQVALKVIARGFSDEAVVRFERERRIVASLQHPEIARLYDGGVTDDGRPYFALEYVDGESVAEYCDRRRLRIRERLELFLRVVRAVHYAHSNLLVHRDLKPDNIFVDSHGHVKLLDFGIAKILDEDAEHQRTYTTSTWMTPQYASPEQITGLSVTTASDQYQLGLLLYELLSGSLPYSVSSRPPAEVIEVICHDSVPLPSTQVGAESAAEARRTTPAALRRRLRGDLDTITDKALRKEAGRRYASVEQLAQDIERHLAGLPVQARKDTLAYRIGKFALRHRAGVAVVALFLALLIGYATTVTIQRRQLAEERDRAQAAAEQSERMKTFLVSLLESASPHHRSGEEVRVVDLLARSVERVDRELHDQPEIQAEMLATIGRAFHSLGRYEASRQLHERALRNQRQLWPGGHEDVASSLNDLAMDYRSLGDYETSERLHREALALRRSLFAEPNGKISGSLHNLASVLVQRGEFEEAEGLYRNALRIDRRLHGGDLNRDVAFDLSSLGYLLAQRGEFAEAEKKLERALSIRRKIYEGTHPSVAKTTRYLGELRLLQGRVKRARPLLEEALLLHRQALPADHLDIAQDLMALGQAELAAGEFERAIELFGEARAMIERLVGEDHRLLARAESGLGQSALRRGGQEEAKRHFEMALLIFQGTVAAEHPETAEVLIGLGEVWLLRGDRAAARRHLRRAFEIRRRVFGENDRRTLAAMERLYDLAG